MVLITILNDGTIITIAYDNVVPGSEPEKWHLRRVYLESALLGGVACVSSLVLLWIAMNSNGDMDAFRDWFHLEPLNYNDFYIYKRSAEAEYNRCSVCAKCF